MKNIIILVALALLVSCQPQTRNEKQVRCYRQHNDITDVWLYWYIVTSGGNNYYYSSPSPVTDFSAVQWGSSAGGFDATQAETLGEVSTPVESAGFEGQENTGQAGEVSEPSESGGFEGSGSGDSGGDSGGDGGGGGE